MTADADAARAQGAGDADRLYGGITLTQLLVNAHAAVVDWMRLQEEVHPESVDGWLLAQQLEQARAAVAAPADPSVSWFPKWAAGAGRADALELLASKVAEFFYPPAAPPREAGRE